MTVAAGLGRTSALHLAEGADRRGDGARDGGHDAARGDPRRRGGPRPGRRVRQLGQGAALADRAGPGHRPVAALPARRRRRRRRSTPRWACCDVDRDCRRGAAARRPRARSPWSSRPRRPGGATARCASWNSTAGGSATFATGEDEAVVLPLEGGCTVVCDGQEFALTGRRNVFARVTDFAYVPRDAEVTVSSADGGRFALPAARATRRLPPATARPRASRSSCAARARPAGRSTTSACPATFEADKLIAVEVLTPERELVVLPAAQARRGPRRRVGAGGDLLLRGRQRAAPATSASTPPARAARSTCAPRCAPATPCSIPHGWHGPSMAAPGYDLYYLNVMAGPGDERVWQICDDPAHAWIRGTWDGPGDRPPPAAHVHGGDEHDIRLTVAQALVKFLANQYSERDGVEQRLIPGMFGIFGHGNVAGVGQALLEVADSGRDALPPGPQRAGHGARRRRLRPDAQPPAGPGLHRVDRPGLDQHGHRRGAGHHQPHPGAAPAQRHLRHPRRQPRAAGAGAALRLRRVRERRVPPAVEVLRPGVAARAAARRAAGRDARAHRPGRDRRGDHRPAAGRAGRGLRLARGAVRQAGVARRPPGARARRSGARRRDHPRRAAAARRRGRRRALLRGHRGAAARSPRPPASRSPTPRRARARCCGTTRRPSAGSAPPARRSPTHWPATPTS